MQKLGNPVPLFIDARGALLDGGHIYVGVADGDPEVSPIDTFWDADLTIPAAQPLRTLGGMIINGVTPAAVFIAEDDFSMRVTDAFETLVFYSPSVFTATDTFQPINANLTAISALATTSYGRNLLVLPNQAALVTATGIPAPLPAAGGTIGGNIIRAGAGAHLYHASPALLSGNVYVTSEGATDPTSQPGDIWLELEP